MIGTPAYKIRFITVILSGYLLAGLGLLYFLGYYTDSPDTVFYLTISRKYAAGEFYAAINNYWSPLISWLLVPFHLAGADPLIGFKTLQLIIGAGTLLVTYRLATTFIQSHHFKQLFMLGMVPSVLSYSLLYPTPDLLFLFLLLVLLNHFLHLIKNPASGPYTWVMAGVSGAFLYFAKSYGFPFFVTSFSVLVIFVFIKEKGNRNKLIKHFLAGITTFFLMAGIWMGCLYFKYGTVSTGYASIYNFNLLCPETYIPGHTNLQHPVLIHGLMDVSSREEASAWESPGSMKQRAWSPLESQAHFQHYLKVISSNWLSFYYFVISRNTGLVFLITLIFYFLTIKNRFHHTNFQSGFVTAFFLLYVSGYSLVFFMPRYLWIASLLILLATFGLLEKIFVHRSFWRHSVLILLTVALFFQIKKPVKELLFKTDRDMNSSNLLYGILHPLKTLTSSYQTSMAIPSLLTKIESLELPEGRVAGIRSADPGRFSYTQTLLLCMYSGYTFFGELEKEISETEASAELRNFKIDYLYCWEPLTFNIPGSRILLNNSESGFYLYRLKN